MVGVAPTIMELQSTALLLGYISIGAAEGNRTLRSVKIGGFQGRLTHHTVHCGMAGIEGIEPPFRDLESLVIPLHYIPMVVLDRIELPTRRASTYCSTY